MQEVHSEPEVVRVAILNDAGDFQLSIRGQYTIYDGASGKVARKGRRLQKIPVRIRNGGILLENERLAADHMRIVLQKDASIYRDSKPKRYRQQVDVYRTSKNKLLVVNTVNLETYVRGVLYHEVPHDWPINAIKAQAVATRSYALYQTSMRKGQLYDVTSDIYSQVYGGRSAERYRSNIAANRTRGQILSYQGKILPAYFHSTCGGKTENVKELWKHNLPPLAGVKCGFCAQSPHNRPWKRNFRSKDIQELLNAHGYKLDLIKDISVIARTPSGRAKTLQVTMRTGTKTTIPAVQFREIIGPNNIKSNFFDIEMKGYYFDVIGRGWGHGVGMCQWGAYQMASQRFPYESILAHYYPGAQIIQVSEL